MKKLSWIIAGYVLAAAIAILAGYFVRDLHPYLVALIADLVGTVVIFAFSVRFNNSSFYDPYWSVIPVLIASYYLVLGGVLTLRTAITVFLVIFWAVRLTWNWTLRWGGFEDEDFRYASYRDRGPVIYWLVSFFGFHLMPTVMVFIGCMPLYPVLALGGRSFSVIDVLAIGITVGAIWIESRSDMELRRFKAVRQPGELLETGLWSISRHPNYFGEVAFWWGLWAFSVGSHPSYWWTVFGAVAITVLFWTISLPMIEKRMLARYPHYTKRIKSTPIMIPFVPVRKK